MVERGSLRGLCDQPPMSKTRESPLRSEVRRLAVHRADCNGSLRHCPGQTGQCRVDPPQALGRATVPPQLPVRSVEAEQTGRPFLQRYALSEQDCAAAG